MLAAIKRACRNSWTVMLARTTAGIGSLAAIASAIWGDPTVNSAVQQVVSPKAWPFIVIGMGALIEFARVYPHRRDGTLD